MIRIRGQAEAGRVPEQGPIPAQAPFVLGIGGTTRAGSSSERALRACLAAAELHHAETACLPAERLAFPMYAPERAQERSADVLGFLDMVRRADGLVIATPGYHGGVSGLIKNALDYLEDARDDPRPYLDGRAVGCIVCAFGWQATATTLVALRSVIHALRGWPTPLGVAINLGERVFSADGSIDARVAANLSLVGRQVASFAHRQAAA